MGTKCELVAKYFVEANYFYLQFLVDFVLLSALPVMGTEYEMSQDFVPLHALVLTRDFKLLTVYPSMNVVRDLLSYSICVLSVWCHDVRTVAK